METAMINIKTSKKLKVGAQETAKELGVPLSTAINVFLRQFVRDRELVISNSYKPSPYLEKVIAEGELEHKASKNRKTYASAGQLFRDLHI
jgi:addiction module RelB/DinJ family antitoxin